MNVLGLLSIQATLAKGHCLHRLLVLMENTSSLKLKQKVMEITLSHLLQKRLVNIIPMYIGVASQYTEAHLLFGYAFLLHEIFILTHSSPDSYIVLLNEKSLTFSFLYRFAILQKKLFGPL